MFCEEEVLEPCRKCGGKPFFLVVRSSWCIKCPKCGHTSSLYHGNGKERATYVWNRMATERRKRNGKEG